MDQQPKDTKHYKSRKLLRLKGFDYGSDGGYFITINIKHRKQFFGKIKNGIMGLSEIGCLAWKCWYEIPKYYPFVILDEFVVMPDHVHGVLFIKKQNLVAPQQETINIRNKFGPQSKNLAAIIRGFKIGVTKNAREIKSVFEWQTRFHDHIIRSKDELNRIKQYIKNNPENWGKNKHEL